MNVPLPVLVGDGTSNKRRRRQAVSETDKTGVLEDEEAVEAHGGGQWSGKTEDEPLPEGGPEGEGARDGGGNWGG
jgi:hypothetical protein